MMARRAYLYFAVTFVLGVVVGGCGLFTYAYYSGHWHREFDRQRVVRHLTQEVHLSDTQVRQVDQILADTAKSYSELHKQVDPQFDAIRAQTRDRIRQILTPEQVVKFNEWVRQADERRRQHSPR
jgi:Spy/CpxP family protein refolding chaperone